MAPAAPIGAIRRVFLALVVLSAFATLSSARAEAAWIAPVAVSGEGLQALDPQVAVDGQGNVTVAWVSGTSPNLAIVVAEHPAGGAWTNPVARLQATEKCDNPKLAVNPAGAAVLVADCETTARLRAVTRTVNGVWSTPSSEIPGSSSGQEPRVGIDDAGNAVVVWVGSVSTVQASYKPAAGGWSAAAQLSTAAKPALEPNVAMSPAGYAHALWREKREVPPGSDPVIEVKAARKQGATAWTAPSSLTGGTTSTTPVAEGEPQIDINAGGERMMAWLLAGTDLLMSSRTSSSDLGGISEPAKSIVEAADVEQPRIALDGAGRGVATWRSFSGEGPRVKAATTSSLSGSWSSPETLAGLGEVVGGTEPDVAAAPAGSATVVWRAGVTVKAASRPAGGTFAPGIPISSATHDGFGEPRVAMDTGGNAIVAWSTNLTRVAVAVNDVTPPAISTAPPAPVVLGSAVGLSAVAVDTWSPTSLAWDFGDGTTATGGSVSHIYATTGTKTATVTATDAAGNSSSATLPVTVTPAPAQGGPGGNSSRHKVVLTANVVKQPWKQRAKAEAIKLRCKLDVAGTCAAKASVGAAVAKRIGLKAGKRQKQVAIGKGSAPVRAGKFAVVKVVLTVKALAAIAAATEPVPVSIALTGSAAGNDPASLTRRLKISRP